MKTKLPIIALFAAIGILFLGIMGILGWLIHNEFLLSVVPGGVRMKFNVAICFIFSSLVLILNYVPTKNKFQKRLIVILPAVVCTIALLTLLEYIFSINIGIDELFIRDDFGTATVYYPGRMSPIAAINFLLIGSGLFLLNKQKTAIYQFFYLSGIGFVSLLMLISFNFISDTPTFMRLAVHAAIGFIILSGAIYFAQPQLQNSISFERKLFTGFAATIILLIVFSVFSIFYSNRNVKTFELIRHTNAVINEAEETLSITKDIESGSRGYVITGDSNYLEHFTIAKDVVFSHIEKLKELIKDNPLQQVRTDSLLSLIDKRIGFSLQSVALRNEKGIEEASKLVATRQGKLYMDKIRVLIAEIQRDENNLLVQRQRENDKSISSFYRAFFVFLTSIFILLAVILYSIRNNINTRKKASEQIQKQTQEVQNFIDSMSTLSAKLAVDGKILMVNKIAQQGSGLTMEELLNTNFTEGQWWAFDPEVHARVRDAFKKACSGTTINYDENIFVFGQVLSINFSLIPILKTRGGVDYIVAEARDITQQKKAEEKLLLINKELESYISQLKESEEKLSILFNSIDEGFCIIQMIFDEEKNPVDYRFLVVNPSFEKQTGLRDTVGKRMREFAPNHEKHWFEIYGRIALTGESIRFENRAEELHRWYDVYAFRFGDPKNLQVAVLFNDITERKQTEETIQQLNLDLEKRVEEKTKEILQLNANLEKKIEERTAELAAVNSELEAFTYSVSHDLRAPLRGIVGFTAILEEDYASKLDKEAKRITAVIKDNTLKMGNLIDDLLAFSRMSRQDIIKASINTAEMVKEVINELGSNNDGTDIEWAIQSLPAIKGDINMIRQVWVNYISNAKKYSRNNKHPRIEIGVLTPNGQTTFFIKDNGVGFDEQYKDKLFKVFQRLHSAAEFEGTGVGLALVEKIISKHGGKVWAEGEVGKGAGFYFSLPSS
jgi:PAS domain S-box-containing protein